MSKKVKFEIGDRVTLILDNEMCKGNIERLHVDLPRPVAIVTLDDGRTTKAYVTDIIPESNVAKEPEKVQEEKPTEPVEKSEITITPEEFRKKSTDLAHEMAKGKPLVEIAIIMFLGCLHKALFFDAVEND